MSSLKLALLPDSTDGAQKVAQQLQTIYSFVSPEECDAIVVLGGDGFMLRSIHGNPTPGKPLYGINCGSVGFLMNAPNLKDFEEEIGRAQEVILHPLKMTVTDIDGVDHTHLAINEVSLFRSTAQAAKIKISVDGSTRLEELVSDGILIATPAGSTAYNLSVHGPILPLGSNLLALTPISPFRPRRWKGAILPDCAKLEIQILDPVKRPVSAVADFYEVNNVLSVRVGLDQKMGYKLLFSPEHNLEDRILGEQFKE